MTKEEQFVNELIGYIFAYFDDDYMTMECLCRKLHKYGLIKKKDGEWTTDFIDRKDENSSEKPNNCEGEDIFEYCPRCGMRLLSKWYEPKDEPQSELCRDCKDYAGNGMFCAKNYMVYDFSRSVCKDEPQERIE